MQLVERHIIRSGSSEYKELDRLCFLSKNLYNAALYTIRQHYFDTGKYLSYYSLNNQFVSSKQSDYYSLPAKVSQQTLKLLDKNFVSFFSLLKKKDPTRKVRLCRYLDKLKGRFSLVYTMQAISKRHLKNGYIKLSGASFKIKTKIAPFSIAQVRVTHKGEHLVIEVVYNVNAKEKKQDNGRYCSIDLGINNLATIASNTIKPVIINGKPLKSINQYYNKKRADLQANLKNGKKTSKRISKLNIKRNNKVQDYLHKSSRIITNHLVSNDINTLVIGYNTQWKQEVNMGSKTNQTFVGIPHSKFIEQLKYKCKLEGILVIYNEESYTSKCSFLDNESIERHDNYVGKRVKRGLFRSGNGREINADLNGALNILKKVVGEFEYPIEACSTPAVLTVKW
jgi:putative transposase